MNIGDYRKEIRSKFSRTHLPWVTIKYAQTLDGKIATKTGDSRWISSLPSRRLVHRLRSRHQAVLVGVNTIIQDDPQLTLRLIKGKNPIRIVVDSKLRSPLKAKIFKGKRGAKTMLAVTSKANKKRIRDLKKKGVEILVLKKNKVGHVDLEDLLQKLGEKNIRSLLVEGGSKVITSFLKQKLVDRMVIVIAPLIIGKGIRGIESMRPRKAGDLPAFSSVKIYECGDDVILDGLIRK